MASDIELARVAAASDWPRTLDPPAVTAALRVTPEDFEVEELPRIEPTGEGGHLWLWVEKRGANTSWVADQLARAAGCASRDVGFAGMKDRHALTRQWYSVPIAGAASPRWNDWNIEGVHVLQASRHGRKLQRGALSGNRFRLVLRDPVGEIAGLSGRLERIAAQGLPNYFGAQRFGHGGANVRRGAQWLRHGGRLPRSKRSIYLSAVRSALFNRSLAARVEAGNWNVLLPGDVGMLDGTHSLFRCDTIDAELERRCRAFDIHPTGPLPGCGGVQPAADAAAIEHGALSGHADLVEALAAAGLEADRRALRLRPGHLSWRVEADRIELGFELPAGAYATAVIRELVTPAG